MFELKVKKNVQIIANAEFDDASVTKRLINNQNQWFVALKKVKTIILFQQRSM